MIDYLHGRNATPQRLSLLSSSLLDLSETAITIFSVLGLFSSQATASLCILFTAEVMPTIIR